MESIKNTVNNATEAVGNYMNEGTAAAKQEGGKQQAKHDDTVSGKLEGAKNYVTEGANKHAEGAKGDTNNPLK